MKTIISSIVAAAFALTSFSALSFHEQVRVTGLYQTSPGSPVWLKLKARTIDPSAFKGHHFKMFTGGKLTTVRVVNTPYCVGKDKAVFSLQDRKGGKIHKETVHFAKGHTCVPVMKKYVKNKGY